MANNIVILDGNSANTTVRTIETAGVHVPVHALDGTQLAALASAAKQDALATIIGDTSSTPPSNTVQDRLKAILAQLVTMSGYVDGLETLITALNGYVDGLETLGTTLNGYVDGLESTGSTTNSLLNSLLSLVGDVSSSPTSNTLLARLKAITDAVSAATGGTASNTAPTYSQNALNQALSLDLHGAIRMLQMDAAGSPLDFTAAADVNLLKVGGATAASGQGASTSGTIRVVIASDNPVMLVKEQASTPVAVLNLSAPQLAHAGATVLTDYFIYNPANSVAYVELFDAVQASDVSIGTTSPKWVLGIPAASGANLTGLNLTFALGLVLAATTTAAGSTAVSTGVQASIGYR